MPAEVFESAILHRCLYPQARLLKHVLLLLNPDYFEADLELIRAAGRLTRASGLAAEVAEYNYHAANSGRLRREWKLRLSVTRLRELVLATLGAEAQAVESLPPFAAAPAAPAGAQPVLAGSRK